MGFWKGFVAGGLAVGLGFGAGFFSKVSAEPTVLDVRAVRIVDKAGKIAGHFGFGENNDLSFMLGRRDGASFLAFFNEQTATFGVRGDDKSVVMVSAGNDGPSVALIDSKTNAGAVEMDKTGKIRLNAMPVSIEKQ